MPIARKVRCSIAHEVLVDATGGRVTMRTAGGAAAALEYVGAATTLWAATAARWAAASWWMWCARAVALTRLRCRSALR